MTKQNKLPYWCHYNFKNAFKLYNYLGESGKKYLGNNSALKKGSESRE